MPDVDKALVNALAQCFATRENVDALLDEAQIDKAHLPVFGGSTPGLYWRGVLAELDKGLLDRGRELLLRAALARYPANKTLQRALLHAPDTGELIVSVGRLPTTDLSHFVAREDELAMLDAAWSGDATGVVQIVAPGGVGKTALTQRWVDELRVDGWRGAERVFGWSFYSQGTDGNASADGFFAEALDFFGWTGESIVSPWKRGETLARLVRKSKTLLVLDGLEPLQHSGTLAGKLKDQGLQALLRELMASSGGLCLISTRISVHELAGRAGVATIDLRTLEPEAGAALLRSLGVEGTEKEMRAASEEMGGHSLALTLLGTYVRDILDGDVRRRQEVDLLDPEADGTAHARKVMEMYETWFRSGADGDDVPELRVLRLLGLFDRPADAATLKALRAEPAIPGLTEGLTKGSEKSWRRVVARLRKARLLLGDAPGAGQGGLDAHPLVRAYFGERLEEECPGAWKEGHLRIYRHLCDTTEDQPADAEGLQPLYQAVVHGCRAGRVREARDEVFWRRIRRGDKAYSLHNLGLFGSELTALSAFFSGSWEAPSTELPEPHRAWLLNAAGFGLRALGRPAEAVEPFVASLALCQKLGDWEEAAIRAGNLSELQLALGEVEEAVCSGRESVELAERSGNWTQRMVKRTTHADALHQAGRLEASVALFREAEALQRDCQPTYPFLYSIRGYLYCDLLLSEARLETKEEASWRLKTVVERATQTLELVTGAGWLLDIALDHLTLGRAHSLLDHPEDAARHLDLAVEGLRRAGHDWVTPSGLIARAAHRRHIGADPLPDLREALDLAERGSMKLHEVDTHLEWTRHALATDDHTTARDHLTKARTLINETGYERRRPELDDLTTRIPK